MRQEEWVQLASTEAIDSKHLGKPIGFRKSSASALWSDTVIGDEVLTPARAQLARAHTHTCSAREGESERERVRERERDRGENPFFSVRSLMSAPPFSLLAWIRDAPTRSFTLWDSSCRPCQTRVYLEVLRRAQVLLFPTILAKEAMRPCRSASSCRGNSAWEMVTWFASANQGPGYFPRLTFLLMNLWYVHEHTVTADSCVFKGDGYIRIWLLKQTRRRNTMLPIWT